MDERVSTTEPVLMGTGTESPTGVGGTGARSRKVETRGKLGPVRAGHGGDDIGGKCFVCGGTGQLHEEGNVQQGDQVVRGNTNGRDNGSGVSLDMGILESHTSRPWIKSFTMVTMLLASIMVLCLGLLISYWLLFNRKPPLILSENNPIRLIEYDALKNYMVVEWEGDIKDSCPGERRQRVVEAGNEPPPRVGLLLQPEPFSADLYPVGFHVIRRMIELPQNRPVPFIYQATWAFTCNPTQVGTNAVFVKSPPLLVE